MLVRKSSLYYIFIFAIIALVYWRFFLPGAHVSMDLHNTYHEELLQQFAFPQAWSASGAIGLGEYTVSVLWAWPIHVIFGFFGLIGFSHEALMKLLGLFPVLSVGIFGIVKLLQSYKLDEQATNVGSTLFLANTYIILLIDGGQINLAMAYALLPLGFYYYKKCLIEYSKPVQFKFTASVVALSVFDIRIVYLLVLLILFHFIFKLVTVKSKLWVIGRHILLGSMAAFFLITVHLYWILPSLFVKTPSLPTTYDRVSQTDFLSFAELKHSISLLQPHWYKNSFGDIQPFRKEFLLIPLFVFVAPLVKRRREVLFWLIIALLSVFLVKGSNPPFPKVYPWLFVNVPGFIVFRDPTKFFFLTALSYSILISFTVSALSKNLKRYLAVTLALYLLFLSRPTWLGLMTGTLSQPIYKNEYKDLASFLDQDKTFGRTLWLPSKPPLGFSSPVHPSLEANRVMQQRSIAVGTLGTYESFNFLREANYIGDLLDVLGVEYIAYPLPDERKKKLKDDEIEYYDNFSSQLESQSWVEEKRLAKPINLYETSKNQYKFFAATNTWLVVGTDRIYQEFADEDELSNNAIVFAQDSLSNINFSPHMQLLYYDSQEEDTFGQHDIYIFLADMFEFEPSEESPIWKREEVDILWLRNFLEQKYSLAYQEFTYEKGVAISEGNNQFTIPANILQNKPLYIRALMSSKGGKLTIAQENSVISEITTKVENPDQITRKLTGFGDILDQEFRYSKAYFQTFKIADRLDTSRDLLISLEGEINILNYIAFGEPKTLSAEETLIWERLSNEEKLNLFKPNGSTVKVEYNQVSPTKYRVKLSGVEEPVTLIFSETYDSLWRLNGEKPYPVYGMINGFSINKNGAYDLEYLPQKYVYYGLPISILSMMFLIMYIIKYGKAKKPLKNRHS